MILKKNEMFFHRYRPQNVTYLLLFRKHEQGNNAVDLPKFDPLVKELEQQISAGCRLNFDREESRKRQRPEFSRIKLSSVADVSSSLESHNSFR